MIVGMKTEQTQEIDEKYNQQNLMWGVGLGKRQDSVKKSWGKLWCCNPEREYSWKSKFGMEDNEFILQ